MQVVRKAVSRSAAPVSIIGSVGGFIGDIIAPLGNVAPWVAGISLIFALAALAGLLALRRKQGVEAWDSPVAGAFFIASASAVIFSLWSVVFAAGPERGYLAENFEPIAQIQAQLLNLQEDVTEIKETTQQTSEQVSAIATAQAQGFADIQAAFAQLQAGEGTLVTNPTTPQEWYSNARLYQLRGDSANAIKAYEGYFAFNLEYVDPYLEYTALLKASEGIARTRQIVGDMLDARPDSQTLDLILTRLLDEPTERLTRLEALAARAPQYGPAFDELGQEYDRALTAAITNAMLQKQAETYATLFKLEEQQLFTRYYIDKSLAEEHLENARKMSAAFATAGNVFGTVDIQIAQFYNGVQFIIILPEQFNARQVLFSIDDPEPKTDMGKNASGLVNTFIPALPVPLGEHTFYMQYVDANGVTSQVYNKPFRVDPISVYFAQQPMDFATNTIPGTFSVGITGLEDFKTTTFNYSIDDDSLSETITGVSVNTIIVNGLTAGDHILYIQGEVEGEAPTDVVEFPFTVK